MKKKTEAAILEIRAPKSTIEKNICLFLKRNNNEASIAQIAEKTDEREIIITQIIQNMSKSRLVNTNNNMVYLNIIPDG